MTKEIQSAVLEEKHEKNEQEETVEEETTEEEFVNEYAKETEELLKNPHLIFEISKKLDLTIIGENKTRALLFLLMLSKDVDPQSAIIMNKASTGKSYVSKELLKLFDNTEKMQFARMTEKFLENLGGNLENKILFVEEYNGVSEEFLRIILSEGEGTLGTLDAITRKARIIHTKGKPSFISCLAGNKVQIGEQMKTRVWLLSVDDSENQTSMILEFLDRKAKIIKHYWDETSYIIFSRLTKHLRINGVKNVLVPFANAKLFGFPSSDVRSRRDYSKFLAIVKTSAYLHQYSRQVANSDGEKFVIASLYDYEIARILTQEHLQPTLLGLSKEVINVYDKIKGWKDQFSIKQVTDETKLSRSRAYVLMEQLVDKNVVEKEKDGKRNVYRIIGGNLENIYLSVCDRITPEFLNESFKKMILDNWSFDADYEAFDKSNLLVPELRQKAAELWKHTQTDRQLDSTIQNAQKVSNIVELSLRTNKEQDPYNDAVNVYQ